MNVYNLVKIYLLIISKFRKNLNLTLTFKKII